MRNSSITQVLFILAMCLPVQAVVVTGNPDAYQAPAGTLYFGLSLDAVVSITSINPGTGSGSFCSGALLAGGTQVLTAAHCVDEGHPVTVGFDTQAGGAYSIGAANVAIDPNWTGSNIWDGADLAVITLATPALGVSGYEIYSGTGGIGANIILAGWGQAGTGATGAIDGSSGTRRVGENTYELTGEAFGGSSGILLGDFDDGTSLHDTIGILDGSLANLGLGSLEVTAAPGDSGGPTFFSGMLIGIHSFGLRLNFGDVDADLNFSFGELWGDTRLSESAFLQTQLVPEPSSVLLCGLGLAALAWNRRRVRAITRKPSIPTVVRR